MSNHYREHLNAINNSLSIVSSPKHPNAINKLPDDQISIIILTFLRRKGQNYKELSQKTFTTTSLSRLLSFRAEATHLEAAMNESFIQVYDHALLVHVLMPDRGQEVPRGPVDQRRLRPAHALAHTLVFVLLPAQTAQQRSQEALLDLLAVLRLADAFLLRYFILSCNRFTLLRIKTPMAVKRTLLKKKEHLFQTFSCLFNFNIVPSLGK